VVVVLFTTKARTDQQMKPALQEQHLMKELFNALEAEDSLRVDQLVHEGAPVNGYYRGMTPLIYVARLNKFAPVAWVLLEAGADVNAHDEYGKTALMWVVDNASKENIELARLLLDYGANICIKDADGRSVWDRIQERQIWDRRKGHGIRELIMARAYQCLAK
jgi:ankyrin repeat protein